MDGAPSLTDKIPFCRPCWGFLPDQTKEAFLSGAANEKRVADAVRIRRADFKQTGKYAKIHFNR